MSSKWGGFNPLSFSLFPLSHCSIAWKRSCCYPSTHHGPPACAPLPWQCLTPGFGVGNCIHPYGQDKDGFCIKNAAV